MSDRVPFGTVVADSMGSARRSSTAELDVGRLIGTHMVVQGNAGAGKSRTFRKIAEATHGRVQHIFLDVEDEYYTLRERFDYIIAGGENGDCPATPANAAQLALVLLEHGLSAIVQLNTLPLAQRRQFVGLFLEAAMAAPRELWHPVLFFQDEADRYAPQAGKVESSEAIVALMDQGRKRGFTGILATQRVAKIDKDALGSANNWMIGRVGQALDRRAGADALGFPPSSDEARGLQALAAGHFWSFGPALSPTPELVHVGDVATTHLRTGDARVPTPPPAAALKEILGALAAASAPPPAAPVRPSGDRPGSGGASTTAGAAPDWASAEELAAAERRGWALGVAETLKVAGEHFGSILDGVAQGMQATLQAAEREVDEAVTGRWALRVAAALNQAPLVTTTGATSFDEPELGAPADAPLEEVRAEPEAAAPRRPSDRAMHLLEVLVMSAPIALTPELWAAFAGTKPGSGWWNAQMKALRQAGFVEVEAGRYSATAAGMEASGRKPTLPRSEVDLWKLWRARIEELIGKGGMSLLWVLAAHRRYALTAEQWGLLAGKAPGSGWWNAGAKGLREWGCIAQSDGRFSVTDKGLALFAEPPEPVVETRKALHEIRAAALKPEGRRLLEAWRDGDTRDDVAARAGLKTGSGYWNSAIKDLLSSGLVTEVDGRLRRATEDLVDA